MKTEKQEKEYNKYKVVLSMGGKDYIQESETIENALAQMGLNWNDIKMKAVASISNEEYSYEHLFQPRQLRRIFSNKLTRMMWAKRLDLLLKSGKKNNKVEKLKI